MLQKSVKSTIERKKDKIKLQIKEKLRLENKTIKKDSRKTWKTNIEKKRLRKFCDLKKVL